MRQQQQPQNQQNQKSILEENQELGEEGRQGQSVRGAMDKKPFSRDGQNEDDESAAGGLDQEPVAAEGDADESAELDQDGSESPGDYESISAAEVEKYLSGVDFPCGREELIECAANNEASEEILELLREFPDEEFRSPVDVAKCFGQVMKRQETAANG